MRDAKNQLKEEYQIEDGMSTKDMPQEYLDRVAELNDQMAKFQKDIEDADRIAREKAREAELEAKRLETEKLRAEGATQVNRNTSKKKQQAYAAQKEVERRAAEQRAAKAAKRGESVEGVPESQVGERRYARGRAYVADRYLNPDEAEEKTAAALAESEEYEPELAPEDTAPELTEQEPVEAEVEETAANEPEETAEVETTAEVEAAAEPDGEAAETEASDETVTKE